MQTPAQTESRGAFECFPKLPLEIRRLIWLSTVQPHILPRRRIGELEACHEARQLLLKVYTLCFLPSFQALVNYPISRYANFDTDIFLINPQIHEGLRIRLNTNEFWSTDWSEVFLPEALNKIKYLAIAVDEWRDINIEVDEDQLVWDDAFFKFSELTAVETLSLVMLPEPDDLYYGSRHDPLVDMTVNDWMADGFDDRKLVQAAALREGFDICLKDARTRFENLEKGLPLWKAPHVQLARIVR